MHTFELAMSSAIEHIRDLECRREHFASIVRRKKGALSFKGSPVFSMIEPRPLSGSVAGVDGGLLVRSLHGMDLLLCKAVGVIFKYSAGCLQDADYFPSPFPMAQPKILSRPLSEHDSELSAGIYRQLTEVSLARQICEKLEPSLMIMHGSVLPHGSSRPAPDSDACDAYLELISEYKRLYRVCAQKSIPLVGVVEDTRGSRFSEILAGLLGDSADNEVLSMTRDTHLLSYVLDQGERTVSFPFAEKPKEHPILRELGEWSELVHAFYMRTAPLDRPLRVDFINNGNAGDIAGLLFPLCVSNQVYGMPSVIIEADARARLSGSEIDLVYNRFLDKAGPLQSLQRLRRDSRPF